MNNDKLAQSVFGKTFSLMPDKTKNGKTSTVKYTMANH